ncbi:integrase family protein [Puniceibacterium sp. IMCC21224]|nr:integrase family protein [Puniceibacterium sp. IMCC21224]
MQTAEGKLYLFVGIDRTSKFAVTQLVNKADRRTAWEFLQHILEAVPYQLHTILTDNGIQFAKQPRNRNIIYSRPMRFDMICEANGNEHRPAKPNHPRTNGPPLGDCLQSPRGQRVERMNRTIKDANVKRFHCDIHAKLRTHLANFMTAYNYARGSRYSAASRHTNTSAKSGLPSREIHHSTDPQKAGNEQIGHSSGMQRMIGPYIAGGGGKAQAMAARLSGTCRDSWRQSRAHARLATTR